jgi:hypothetical protein
MVKATYGLKRRGIYYKTWRKEGSYFFFEKSWIYLLWSLASVAMVTDRYVSLLTKLKMGLFKRRAIFENSKAAFS